MSDPIKVHTKTLLHPTKYIMTTNNRGLVLKPNQIWDGDNNFKFKIGGRSDSDYAVNTNGRRILS